MHFTSVLFPAPFSPRIAWKAPGASLSDTSSSAVRAPKRFVIPRTSTSGGRIMSSPRRGLRPPTSVRSFADRQLVGGAEERVGWRPAPDEKHQGEHGWRRVEEVGVRG